MYQHQFRAASANIHDDRIGIFQYVILFEHILDGDIGEAILFRAFDDLDVDLRRHVNAIHEGIPVFRFTHGTGGDRANLIVVGNPVLGHHAAKAQQYFDAILDGGGLNASGAECVLAKPQGLLE